jgi:hypothetical protein
LGDTEESAVAEYEFEGWGGGRWRVRTDIQVDESKWFIGGSAGGREFGEGSSPGIEGGFRQAMAPTEYAHGQATVLPAFQELLPVPLFARVTGFALWHGQSLQDRVDEDHVPKITDLARTGPTGRLRLNRILRSPSCFADSRGWPDGFSVAVVIYAVEQVGLWGLFLFRVWKREPSIADFYTADGKSPAIPVRGR